MDEERPPQQQWSDAAYYDETDTSVDEPNPATGEVSTYPLPIDYATDPYAMMSAVDPSTYSMMFAQPIYSPVEQPPTFDAMQREMQMHTLIAQILQPPNADPVAHAHAALQLFQLIDGNESLGVEPFTGILHVLDGVFYNPRAHPLVKRHVALVIGCVGSLMPFQWNEYVEYIFTRAASLNAANDELSFYLFALEATLHLSHRRRVCVNDKDARVAAHRLLAVMDSASASVVIVTPLLRCCQMLAVNYPIVFQSFYKDVMDIVCGWLTDADALTTGDEMRSAAVDLLATMTPWMLVHGQHTDEYLHLFDRDMVDNCQHMKTTPSTEMLRLVTRTSLILRCATATTMSDALTEMIDLNTATISSIVCKLGAVNCKPSERNSVRRVVVESLSDVLDSFVIPLTAVANDKRAKHAPLQLMVLLLLFEKGIVPLLRAMMAEGEYGLAAGSLVKLCHANDNAFVDAFVQRRMYDVVQQIVLDGDASLCDSVCKFVAGLLHGASSITLQRRTALVDHLLEDAHRLLVILPEAETTSYARLEMLLLTLLDVDMRQFPPTTVERHSAWMAKAWTLVTTTDCIFARPSFAGILIALQCRSTSEEVANELCAIYGRAMRASQCRLRPMLFAMMGKLLDSAVTPSSTSNRDDAQRRRRIVRTVLTSFRARPSAHDNRIAASVVRRTVRLMHLLDDQDLWLLSCEVAVEVHERQSDDGLLDMASTQLTDMPNALLMCRLPLPSLYSDITADLHVRPGMMRRLTNIVLNMADDVNDAMPKTTGNAIEELTQIYLSSVVTSVRRPSPTQVSRWASRAFSMEVVGNSLASPLGDASKTIYQFEHSLRTSLSNVVEGRTSMESWRVRALIDAYHSFTDHVHSSSPSPSIYKTATKFFKANGAKIESWIAKMRCTVISLSFAHRHPALLLHSALAAELTVGEQMSTEVGIMWECLCRSLVADRKYDMANGILYHLQSTYGETPHLCKWFNAVTLLTADRAEEAYLALYQVICAEEQLYWSFLPSNMQTMLIGWFVQCEEMLCVDQRTSDDTAEAVMRRSAEECTTALGSWDHLLGDPDHQAQFTNVRQVQDATTSGLLQSTAAVHDALHTFNVGSRSRVVNALLLHASMDGQSIDVVRNVYNASQSVLAAQPMHVLRRVEAEVPVDTHNLNRSDVYHRASLVAQTTGNSSLSLLHLCTDILGAQRPTITQVMSLDGDNRRQMMGKLVHSALCASGEGKTDVRLAVRRVQHICRLLADTNDLAGATRLSSECVSIVEGEEEVIVPLLCDMSERCRTMDMTRFNQADEVQCNDSIWTELISSPTSSPIAPFAQRLFDHQTDSSCATAGISHYMQLSGSIASLAVSLAPTNVRAHVLYADWAASNAEQTVSPSSMVPLQGDTENAVTDCFAMSPSLQQAAQVLIAFEHYKSHFGLPRVDGDTTIEFVSSVGGVDGERLLGVWRGRMANSVSLTIKACQTYARHIALHDPLASSSTRSALRLLHMYCDMSYSLPPSVGRLLAESNIHVWLQCIPQLFARLGHPNAEVRDALCELLERICDTAPHLVSYAALAGMQRTPAHDDEEEESRRITHDSDAEVASAMACRRIVVALRTKHAALTRDTAAWTQELRRLQTLHAEVWHNAVQGCANDMQRRLRESEEETRRTLENGEVNEESKTIVVAAKRRASFDMIFGAFEALYERTCVGERAASPDERAFVALHSAQLHAATNAYRASPDNPSAAWASLKSCVNEVRERYIERLQAHGGNASTGKCWPLAELSPLLADMNDTRVPLPGQSAQCLPDDLIYITCLESTVEAVETKTRPKKLRVRTSDGGRHTFLLKAGEDLRLDERIQQILTTVNTLLREKERHSGDAYARHYAVTPLGIKSGLIRFVDDVSPLSAVYKDWLALRQPRGVEGEEEGTMGGTSRFLTVLRSQLNTHNAAQWPSTMGAKDVLAARAKWPRSVVASTMLILTEETPDDLLSNELELHCPDVDTLTVRRHRLCTSAAVMSVLGYVLGLGDRHSENILLDVNKCEFVHVDYNMCFERGRRLATAETVPFRMTPNVERALGPMALRGLFVGHAAHVMQQLRAAGDTLGHMVDAFVCDPLIEWTDYDCIMRTPLPQHAHRALLSGLAAQAIHTSVLPHTLLLHAHQTIRLSTSQLSHVERLAWSVYGAFVIEQGHAFQCQTANLGELAGATLEHVRQLLLAIVEVAEVTALNGIVIPPQLIAQISRRDALILSIRSGLAALSKGCRDHLRLMHSLRMPLHILQLRNERVRGIFAAYVLQVKQPAGELLSLFDGDETRWDDLSTVHRVRGLLESIVHHPPYHLLQLRVHEPSDENSLQSSPSLAPVRSDIAEQNVRGIRNKLKGVDVQLLADVQGLTSGGITRLDDVHVHVNALTTLATSRRHLLAMYEGWTAWL